MTLPLVLASASPRRLQLLVSAGFDPVVRESDLDDAHVRRGRVRPELFVLALSWFKAARVRMAGGCEGSVILAADTECLDNDELLGKPKHADDARRMIQTLRSRAHRTVTGVSLLAADGRRDLFVDTALVTIGSISDAEIDAYVASEGWRGKAGGYNFADRVAAGWPLRVAGDATSVMGLPMHRLRDRLRRFGVFSRHEAHR